MPSTFDYRRIQADHIQRAFAALDAGEKHNFDPSKVYDAVHNGKRYAPKAVVGVAYRFATGDTVGPSDFSAGNSPGQANGILRSLGVSIVERTPPDQSRRWWAFAAGDNEGEAWPLFQRLGCVAHHGADLGDLRNYASEEDMETAIRKIKGTDKRSTNDARGNWETSRVMRPGHYVIAKTGIRRVLGIGRIVSDYRFVPGSENDYNHQLEVEWLWTKGADFTADKALPLKTVTDVSHRLDIIDFAKQLLSSAGLSVAPIAPTAFAIGDALSRPQLRALLGLDKLRGGNWDTGYHFHNGEWFLFPNIGTPGRTGHDYDNRWVDGRLHWYGKPDTTGEQPAIKRLIAPGAIVHLFTREADRDKFTYHGLVRPHNVIPKTEPVEIIWEITSTPTIAPMAEEVDDSVEYTEGATKTVTVNAYERNAAARAACLARWGCRCAVCGIAMDGVYGSELEGFIHVHHLKPIAKAGQVYVIDPITDLRPVCPNCHAALHARKDPPFSIEEVKAMMTAARERLELANRNQS